MSEVHLRAATASDGRFLAEMLAEACDWRPDVITRPVADLMDVPGLWHYIDAWPRPSDFGLIAAYEQPVGAAWWRYFMVDHPGYGFIDETVPEPSIGVADGFRDRGIGRMLLYGLINEGRILGIAGLGLSVEPENPALRLYERLGFQAVGGIGGSVTMLLNLQVSSR